MPDHEARIAALEAAVAELTTAVIALAAANGTTYAQLAMRPARWGE